MSEEDKNRAVVVDHHHHHHEHPQQPPPPPQYGTFQGVANYPPPPPPPAIGFPQPVPPPGVAEPSAPYYPHGYQTVQGYAVAEGRPVRERRLPCCGIGVGWCLFIIGFFLGAIPWYIGLFVLLCARIDPREKPGYIACTIAGDISNCMDISSLEVHVTYDENNKVYHTIANKLLMAVLATIVIILGVTKGTEDR